VAAVGGGVEVGVTLRAGAYTTRAAAKLLRVPQSQIRAYVRAGFVEAERDLTGSYRLSFKDLIVLRVAASLQSGLVSGRRIHRALRALRKQIGDERGLSELRISARDGRVFARDGTAAWNAESGQLLFDFESGAAAPPPAAISAAGTAASLGERRGAVARQNAEQYYEHGIELEDTDPAQARRLYERALELDPDHADAHIDLGHLLHEQGDADAAEAHYRAALAARPGDAIASYNLGVALEDLGRKEEAIGAYEAAVNSDPKLADAYWNLGELYHEQGLGQAALRAMKSYLSLTKNWPR
jgi:tetratricopeptide (TPR) repeat protein